MDLPSSLTVTAVCVFGSVVVAFAVGFGNSGDSCCRTSFVNVGTLAVAFGEFRFLEFPVSLFEFVLVVLFDLFELIVLFVLEVCVQY